MRPSEWQPIETAEGGEDLLLAWVETGEMRVGYFNGRGWLCDGVSFDAEPTHWMPLPAPPPKGDTDNG